MLADNPENGSFHPIYPSVSEFLTLGTPEVSYAVRRHQQLEADRGYGKPIDIAFVEKLMAIGRAHIGSVLANYPLGTGPYPNQLKQQHQEGVATSLAAIAFGASYIALHDFLQQKAPDQHGDYEFDNTYYFTLFDTLLIGQSMTHKNAFRENTPEPKYHISYSDRINMQTNARNYSLANLFEFWSWGLLPQSIRLLIQGVGMQQEVQRLTPKFKSLLDAISTPEEKTAMSEQFVSKNQEPSRRNREPDDNLSGLLGDLGYLVESPSEQKSSPPDKSTRPNEPTTSDPNAQWNNKDWFNKLFGE